MGVDYSYAGTASYPRFQEELTAVARVLGGNKIYNKPLRFEFRKGTNPIIIKWMNNIYSPLTLKETKIVAKEIFRHKNIKHLSCQIWHELEKCIKFNDNWWID